MNANLFHLIRFVMVAAIFLLSGTAYSALDPGFKPVFGSQWPAWWGASHHDDIVIVQPDGKILVTGSFFSINGQTRNNLARLNKDGSLDISFNPEPNGPVRGMVLQPDGKILIHGMFTTIQGHQLAIGFARLHPDGSLDLSFVPYQGGSPIALQKDGKILIDGSTQPGIDGIVREQYLVRLNPDGSLDSGFKTSLNYITTGIIVLPDNKILASTLYFTEPTRLNPDGSTDLTFQRPFIMQNCGECENLYDMKVQQDGKILIAGGIVSVNGEPTSLIARLNTDGTLDTTFQPPLYSSDLGRDGYTYYSYVSCITIQPDGRILVGGVFSLDGKTVTNLVRLEKDGSIDTGFAYRFTGTSSLDGAVHEIDVESDGNLLIIGDFWEIDGLPWDGMARIITADAEPARKPNITIMDSVEPANDLKILFGSIPVGTSLYHTLTIRNDGDAELVLKNSGSGDSLAMPFAFKDDACSGKTLAPAASCTVTIEFAPASDRFFDERFTIESSDPDETSAIVLVSGTGVNNNLPPGKVKLLYPADGQQNLDTTLSVKWSPVTDPEGDQLTYEVRLSTGPDFSNPIISKTSVLDGMLYAGAGFGIFAFTFLLTPIRKNSEKIRLLGLICIVAAVSFAACDGSSADTSNMAPAGSENRDLTQEPTEGISRQITGLANSTTYYWKVIARDEIGNETESAIWSFKTK